MNFNNLNLESNFDFGKFKIYNPKKIMEPNQTTTGS